MTPADRVAAMIRQYISDEMDVTKIIQDATFSLAYRERAWAKKILLGRLLSELVALQAEIRARENDDSSAAAR